MVDTACSQDCCWPCPGGHILGKLLTALSTCGLETRKLQSWHWIQLLVSALTVSRRKGPEMLRATVLDRFSLVSSKE